MNTPAPATGYIYAYALMEPQPYAAQMQSEMIGEIETNRPQYLVFVSNPESWTIRPGSDRSIFNWFAKYSAKYYDRVALVDQISWDKTFFASGGKIKDYHLTGADYVGIFKRKPAGN